MMRQPKAVPTPLFDELVAARARTDALFASVPEASMYARPIAERHRLAFYLGHLEAFDTNLLRARDRGQPATDLERLFAFGIDPLGQSLPSDQASDWPALVQIHDFATASRRRLDAWLAQADVRATIDGTSLATLLQVAIEHRLMHAETLAYLLNRLPATKSTRGLARNERAFDDADLVPIAAGAVTLGTDGEADAAFTWDNERPALQVEVAAFAIDRHMVTNSQYRRFVEDGGYADARWWTPPDRAWREHAQVTYPASWCAANGDWLLVSRFDRVPFQGDWPVHVSHAEASAYAAWAHKRLPTEAEWQRAAYATPHGRERAFPWGDAPPSARHGVFDFARWDPLAVDAHPQGTSAFGVAGLIGNGWEWTSTRFAPLPGFSASGFYPGYSADFFDDRHFVLKGGSAHTAARLLRRSFRNWFQAHYPYAFTGFRCARSS